MLKCAPHCAGVMENTPTVHDVIGSSGQVEQTCGLHGPVLSNIEPRQKLVCGVDAVGVYVDSVDLAGAQSQSGGHGQARAAAYIKNSRSSYLSIWKQLDQSLLSLRDAFFICDGGKGLPILAKCEAIDCRSRVHVRVPVEESMWVTLMRDAASRSYSAAASPLRRSGPPADPA